MWRYPLVFNLVHCLLILCQASDDCQIPTEDNEVSICSYCSDDHAGVRWAVHPSVQNKYPTGPYMLSIRFHCHNSTLNLIDATQDDCFSGIGVPILTSLPEPSVWRWHILGQRLPEGTVCQFTAKVENAYYLEISQLSTSCTIGGNESLVMPATCSESTEQSCPCQCSESFSANQEVVNSLTCKNIDECSEGIHNCINASDCVDTDGSYYCINDTTLAPSGPPTTTEMFSSTTSSTETTFIPTTTITDTIISSPTTTAYSSTDALTTESSSSNGCLMGNHTCSKHAVCRNVKGSYTCECVNGFEGNGINCTSIVPMFQVSDSRNVIIGISVAASLAVVLILLFVVITGIIVRIILKSIPKQQKENYHEKEVEVANGSISGTMNNVKLSGSLVKENLPLCGEMDFVVVKNYVN